VLSIHDAHTAVFQALGAGAAGVALKRTAAVDLTEVVDAVLAGKTYASAVLGWRPELEGHE
jgi:DNA-binding NarL/FixJ family response regulator